MLFSENINYIYSGYQTKTTNDRESHYAFSRNAYAKCLNDSRKHPISITSNIFIRRTIEINIRIKKNLADHIAFSVNQFQDIVIKDVSRFNVTSLKS